METSDLIKSVFAIIIALGFIYWLYKEAKNAPSFDDLWGPDPYKDLTPREVEILKLKKMEEEIREQLKRVEVLIKKKESRIKNN